MNSSVTADPNDIVITGYGAITPLGHDALAFHQALLQGRSAVQFVEPLADVDGQKWMCALIKDFDAKQHVHPRKTIKVMCREIQLAFASAMQACQMSGIQAGTVNPDRIGTVFSGEIIFSELIDVETVVRVCSRDGVMDHSRYGAEAMDNIYPLWMLKSLPNMAPCHVGIAIDARGPNNTITTEATSGLNSVLEAICVIRRGQADVMIVGSTGSRATYTRMLQRYEEDFSKAYASPETACKPFDARRDGGVSGEASCAVILERRSHALARNVPILGTVTAWANTFGNSGEHRWSASKRGTANVLRQLLKRSGVSADRIDHVNAAGGGLIEGDAGEAAAIREVLGDVPVVSYKGAIGDSISASGIVEWVASLVGLRSGLIAPTTNFEQPAKDCPVNVIAGEPKKVTQRNAIKLSLNGNGHCIGVMLATPE